MAKVWPVFEGKEPTHGEPWAVLPLDEAVRTLRVEKKHFLSEPSRTPRFGDASRESRLAGYRHVVVEVEHAEARKGGWKPGFYRSPLDPDAAFNRLIEQAAVSNLGANNVARVIVEPALDSEGEEALRVTVVLKRYRAKQLSGDAVLDTLVSIRRRSQEMGEQRMPLVQYATEQELKQNVGS